MCLPVLGITRDSHVCPSALDLDNIEFVVAVRFWVRILEVARLSRATLKMVSVIGATFLIL